MTSSKYIQLTDKILMEYEYFNVAEATSIEKAEYQVPVSGSVYTNANSEAKYLVSNALTKCRANNKSSEKEFNIDNNLYCLRKENPKLYVSRACNTKTFATAEVFMQNEPQDYYKEQENQPTGKKINCDKVKIYFAQSYTEEQDGRFTITISTNYRYYKSQEDKEQNKYEAKPFILANYVLDEYEAVPTPFLIGEKLYARVIEFYVPSSYDNMANMFGEKLVYPAKIDISLSKIIKETQNSYHAGRYDWIDVLNLVDISSTSISSVDQYATIFASIEEVDDYFKLEGATKNTWKTFNDFISDLPGTAEDYILMHDITVNELVTNTAQGEPDWKITTHNVITQTDDFDEPTLFRPVIKYSNCIACVLDYTLRIYCNSNNTQIIKRATYQDFNFSKYGKKLLKINLGTVPPQLNVYNKIDNSKISDLTIVNNANMNIDKEKNFKTFYVTSFRDRINVKASISPVKIDDVLE